MISICFVMYKYAVTNMCIVTELTYVVHVALADISRQYKTMQHEMSLRNTMLEIDVHQLSANLGKCNTDIPLVKYVIADHIAFACLGCYL